VDVAGDLLPNMLRPFLALLHARPLLQVVLADDSGGLIDLNEIYHRCAPSPLFTEVTEVECFWSFRRVAVNYPETAIPAESGAEHIV
jgi:hypothetical protein